MKNGYARKKKNRIQKTTREKDCESQVERVKVKKKVKPHFAQGGGRTTKKKTKKWVAPTKKNKKNKKTTPREGGFLSGRGLKSKTGFNGEGVQSSERYPTPV